MNNSVGIIIKNKRLAKGLSQSDLAYGICSKEHIYRIENSKRLPSAYLLNLLAIKLGKDLIIDIYFKPCNWDI